MNRSEISKFMDKICKPSFTGENDYYSRDKVLHIIMQLFKNGSKNSRLDGVSKPNFVEWMHSKGYWLGHDDRWRGSDILTVDEFLKLRKEHFDL